jgi:diadenosine tetraphosphate (Ap4A) HIT family hydrolase
VTDCVFCPANWDKLDIVQEINGSHLTGRMGKMIVVRPLDPVTEGHVLIIHERHSKDLSDDLFVAMETAAAAAAHVRSERIVRGESFQANIITSVGPHATQTVMHTHVHVVPRRENDGLPLPWTPQHELKKLRAIQALQQIAAESRLDNYSHGIFQQQSPPSWLNGAAAAAHGYIEKITGGDGGPLMRPSNPYLATEGIGYDDSDD